jgi:hypothetical protein
LQAPPAPPPAPPASADPSACGALGCRLYDTPAAAFATVLAHKPLVLGLGEAHAQKAVPGVRSSAARFTTELLPTLKDSASDLVIELMVPPSGCEQKTKAAVQRKVDKITEKQADTNQNEYLVMGDEAKRLGIQPHLIHPTCADFRALNAPGADPADAALRLVGRLMHESAEKLLARNEKAGVEKMVVLYGGAIHNDVDPIEAARPYSFGPPLVTLTKGRYVELDLFVPELVHDSGMWLRFPWYAHFDKKAHPDKVTMFTMAPSSFAVLLPATVNPP